MVCGAGTQVDDRELRQTLRCYLPDYMVPSIFHEVQTLPLTPNGKIDRQRLLDIAKPLPAMIEPAANDLEHKICELWSNVLRRPMGRNDDLILAGADSIQIFQITARARASGMAIQAKDLLQHRTPAELATFISQTPKATPLPTPRLADFRRTRQVTLAGE